MQHIDSRERLLTLLKLLQSRKSVSVEEVRVYFEAVYGTAPDRKSIYRDLAAIEKHYPLHVLSRNKYGVPRYSL